MNWEELEVITFAMAVSFIKTRKYKPAPAYDGPDKVQYFREENLKEELCGDPTLTWIIAFYAPWSNACVRMAPVFAQLSAEFTNDKLKFGKIDITRFPTVATEYNIDVGVMSKQIPTIILFEGGKEITRRPAISVTGKVLMSFNFAKENILYSFDLNDLYQKTKCKAKKDSGHQKDD